MKRNRNKENRINEETQKMNILKRLWQEDDGQGLTEYTLAMVLVALVIWLGVKIPALEIA